MIVQLKFFKLITLWIVYFAYLSDTDRIRLLYQKVIQYSESKKAVRGRLIKKTIETICGQDNN